MKAIKYLYISFLLFLVGCYESEELSTPVNSGNSGIQTELDQYIEDNFTEKYGMAIRYKYVDDYINPGERVAPVRIEMVRPMLDFIEEFWIGPYLDVENGKVFFENHVPAEIIFLGGVIYDANGNLKLGVADAGARITFTNVNAFDLSDIEWRDLQLRVLYHEFSHTVHQRYKLPTAFETITADGYTSSGAWFTLTDQEALERGFVSPYSTSSPNEDFADLVAYYLYYTDFFEDFINEDENCTTEECLATNEGKAKISTKLNAIREHYEKVTGINLDKLREAVQARL